MSKSKLGKHKSVDKELRPSLSWLESLEEVSKVVIGLSESARHSFAPGVLRYRSDVAGGIKINAYGGKGVVDIFVKVADDDRQKLISKLRIGGMSKIKLLYRLLLKDRSAKMCFQSFRSAPGGR